MPRDLQTNGQMSAFAESEFREATPGHRRRSLFIKIAGAGEG